MRKMDIDNDIKDIRNDIERIKGDLDSINRVQVLSNSTVILQDLRNKVRGSRLMLAILFLTKTKLSSGELSRQLGIDQANLNKFVNPLHDGGLLYREKEGNNVYYRRSSRLDLIGFESQPEFKTSYESWKKKRLAERDSQ